MSNDNTNHPCKIIKNSFRIRIVVLFFICSYFSVAQNSSDIEKKINLYLQKADSCKVNFDYENSFSYILKALSLAQENNNINAEILSNIKFTELYRHAVLFEKATFYLDKTEQLIKKNKTKVTSINLMYFYNRKAALFSEYYKIPDSTLYYSQEVLKLLKTTQNNEIQLTTLMEIGLVYEEKEEYQKAIDYYQQAFELAKLNQKKTESCDALVNTARVFKKEGKNKEAIQKCDEGLAILEGSNVVFQKLLFYEIKQKAYENIGNQALAYENLKLRLKYSNLFYEKNTKDKLLEISNKFEILERDNEILKHIHDLETVKRNQLLLMSIILFFVLGLLSLIYYSKKIKMINKQLDFYSKENAFLLKEANHRINNNLQLIIILLSEELDKAENYDNISLKKILAKIESISTLHRHLYQSKDKKTVDIKDYLNEIVTNFNDVFEEKDVKIKYNFERLELAIDLAMYLGLLITELFINSIKYAFNNQEEKEISLTIYKNENKLYLDYKDNGEKTIGKKIEPNLIETICQQIKAHYKIETKSGFEFYLTKDL